METYAELCKGYTILGWLDAWNVINRDEDVRNLEILLRRSSDLDKADREILSSTFSSTLKEITTSFCKICFDSFNDHGHIERLLEKHTGNKTIEGATRHKKLQGLL